MPVHLDIERIKQVPNECEPTCLKQIADFYGIDVSLDELISRISTDRFRWHNWDFNTARVARELGLESVVYTRSAGIFDPTWVGLSGDELAEKLREEVDYLNTENYNGLPSNPEDAAAALRYVEGGGTIQFVPITSKLIRGVLDNRHPLLAGVNFNLMTGVSREKVLPDGSWVKDDVKGNSYGHIVVLNGYDADNISVVDPWPYSEASYFVNEDVLIDSILRNDANVIEVYKPE